MNKIEPIYAAIGKNITKARLRAGMSQQAVGDMLEPPVTRAAISLMEIGHQRIMLHTLLQLSKILHIHFRRLLRQQAPGRRKALKAGRMVARHKGEQDGKQEGLFL